MIVTFERGGRMQEIEFDAVAREVHGKTATATEHNVEKGSNISDHVRPGADTLSVEALVSNTPLRLPRTQNRGATAQTAAKQFQIDTFTRFGPANVQGRKIIGVNMLQFTGEFDRIKDVYIELRDIVENSRLCSIRTTGQNDKQTTGVIDYTDMVILNLSAPREVKDGSAIAFSFDAKKLRIVETRKAAAPAGRIKKGKQSKKEVKPEEKTKEKKASLAYQAFHAALGALQ